MHSLLKRGGKVKMTTTLLETYSIALEGTSDLNRRILKENRELQAEVKRLKAEDEESMGWIEQYKAEIKSLKADAKHDADVCYDLDDKHIKIIDELKADNKKAREYIVHVEKENDTLKYANTMFHAKEWFDNNSKCNKVYVFVLDADGVNDDGWIADSHAVVSVNDGNCVGSYDRKVIDNS